MDILQSLTDYGMSEKEAQIYLLCLEYGTIQPAKIASLTNINRTTCYDILDSMVRKGVLLSTMHLGQKKYSAIDPSLLFLDLQNKFNSFESILPALIAVSQKFSVKPSIKIYEGIEGVKKVYLETLSSTVDIHAFVGNQVASPEIIERFAKTYLPERRQRKIRAHVILCHSEANTQYHTADNEYFRESRFLDESTISFSCELGCFGPDKIMIALYNSADMYGIIIESHHLYSTLTGLFAYIWTGLGTTHHPQKL